MSKSQSELQFEQEFIEYLTQIGGTKQWRYEPNLKSDEALWDNFKKILERNNYNRIGGKLSYNEFDQVKRYIESIETPYKAGQFLYGVNGVSEIEVDLDNGKHVFLTVFDQAMVGAGNTVYQVVNQVSRDKIITGGRNRRFDVTLLINGLPIIQIELKKAKHSANESLNQMENYIYEHMYEGIYSTIQILIAMTPYDVRYMANATPAMFNKDFAFKWQSEKTSEPIYDWKEFSDLVLSIPMAHNMATRYMILDGTKNKECIKVMRPYQVYATKQVLNKIKCHNFEFDDGRLGYIWHTTGSGKTITSFKTAWLASKLPNVDKVVFLVDRIALTQQTFNDYKAYDPVAGFEGKTGIVRDTANVNDLRKKLNSKSEQNIIVTSIQKMARYVSRKDFKPLNKHIMFIVDEAHRSMGDGKEFTDVGKESMGMFETIRKKIPTSAWVGYTGTPRFPETNKVFGEALHIYTIKNAIADRNVLGFKVEFKETIKEPENPTEEEIDEQVKTSVYDSSMQHVELVVKDILDNWKARSNNRKYNAILTVHVGGGKASFPRAMDYYNEIQKENAKLGKDKIKVAVCFSMDTSNDDNQTANNQALIKVMNEYMDEFGGNYGLENYKDYMEDIRTRLDKTADDGKYLDLVIVVDQFLTGFNAPELNTLYVDRMFKDGNLIQAYSRTNRIHNMVDKPWGNVVNYRWPKENEERMNKAFAVYANRLSATEQSTLEVDKMGNIDDGIIAEDFSVVKEKLSKVVKRLAELTNHFKKTPESEKQQNEVFDLMKSYSSLVSQLKQYTKDDKGEKISAYDNKDEFYEHIGINLEEEVILTSVILDDIKRRRAKTNNIDISEINFEMVHVHNVTIDYDYLVELMAKMADEVHADNMTAAYNTKKDIDIELAKSDNDKFKDKIRDFANKILTKEYEFEQYPAPTNPEKMNEAMDIAVKRSNLMRIRNFISYWGLDNSTKPKDIEAIISKHNIGQNDLDKQGELNDIMLSAKDEYQQLSDESVAGLIWIKYRNQLRSAFMELADEIKRGE